MMLGDKAGFMPCRAEGRGESLRETQVFTARKGWKSGTSPSRKGVHDFSPEPGENQKLNIHTWTWP